MLVVGLSGTERFVGLDPRYLLDVRRWFRTAFCSRYMRTSERPEAAEWPVPSSLPRRTAQVRLAENVVEDVHDDGRAGGSLRRR